MQTNNTRQHKALENRVRREAQRKATCCAAHAYTTTPTARTSSSVTVAGTGCPAQRRHRTRSGAARVKPWRASPEELRHLPG